MRRTAAVCIFFVSFAHAASSFDLSADFSFQKNPNKVWQYGYSATNSLDPAEFRVDKYADSSGPVGFWHPSVSSGPGQTVSLCGVQHHKAVADGFKTMDGLCARARSLWKPATQDSTV